MTFAYVTIPALNEIAGFSIDSASGTLTPLAGSPFPAGQGPSATAESDGGYFLYVVNAGSSTLSVYSIDQTSFALTPVSGSPFALGPVTQRDLVLRGAIMTERGQRIRCEGALRASRRGSFPKGRDAHVARLFSAHCCAVDDVELAHVWNRVNQPADALRIPREASSGVEKTLRILTSPRSRTTQSVNVPPVSTPMRIEQDSGVRSQEPEVSSQKTCFLPEGISHELSLAIAHEKGMDSRFCGNDKPGVIPAKAGTH